MKNNKNIALFLMLSVLPASLWGVYQAPNTIHSFPEDFAEVASGATLVVIGANRREVNREHSLPEVPFGRDYGNVYFIQVDEVLACSASHLGGGKPEISEFIVVVDTRTRPTASILFEWPSIFFLQPVFVNDTPYHPLSPIGGVKQTDAILDMAEQFDLELEIIFTPVYPKNLGVFPAVQYDSFNYPGREKFPDEEMWGWELERLQNAWGLNDFSQVSPFVRKALLPFFEQVDADWFIRKSGEMDAGEPLRRVGEALVERFEYEKKFKPTSHQHRKAIRVPFVAGSVLTNENLTGDFPSLGSGDENRKAKKAKEADPE